jgi:predicted metal-dependent HD superfamily phosphohydrolase
MMEILALQQQMIAYMGGDARRIQHFIKVHAFAKMIGTLEKLPPATQYILEVAALTHDIGIRMGEKKYGASMVTGKIQEQEGPAEAKKMLTQLGCDPKVIDRVCYLIGHHHTFEHIVDADYQILVEADFLVNLYEDGLPLENVQTALTKIFRTPSGIKLCETMFGLKKTA